MRGLLKIFRASGGNINERLRISINQREPGALHLNHHAMSSAKGMTNILQRELEVRDFTRLERGRLLEALPKLAAQDVTSHELLVASHREMGRIRIRVRMITPVKRR